MRTFSKIVQVNLEFFEDFYQLIFILVKCSMGRGWDVLPGMSLKFLAAQDNDEVESEKEPELVFK